MFEEIIRLCIAFWMQGFIGFKEIVEKTRSYLSVGVLKEFFIRDLTEFIRENGFSEYFTPDGFEEFDVYKGNILRCVKQFISWNVYKLCLEFFKIYIERHFEDSCVKHSKFASNCIISIDKLLEYLETHFKSLKELGKETNNEKTEKLREKLREYFEMVVMNRVNLLLWDNMKHLQIPADYVSRYFREVQNMLYNRYEDSELLMHYRSLLDVMFNNYRTIASKQSMKIIDDVDVKETLDAFTKQLIHEQFDLTAIENVFEQFCEKYFIITYQYRNYIANRVKYDLDHEFEQKCEEVKSNHADIEKRSKFMKEAEDIAERLSEINAEMYRTHSLEEWRRILRAELLGNTQKQGE